MLSLREGKVKADRASYRHCNRLSRPGKKCWRTDRVPILPGLVRSWSLPWCVLTVHGNEPVYSSDFVERMRLPHQYVLY